MALSLAFTFPSCSDGSSGGSDDDSGQVTNTANAGTSGENSNPSITTTADKAAEFITSLESGEYNIAVTGAITNDTISAISAALKNNGKAKVSLDLSQTTGLDSIGYDAFNGCNSLVSVNIPASVTSIGISAFYNCSSLASVSIPDSVTSIGISAFQYCTSLSSMAIPDSVVSIGGFAFSYCSSLKSLNIPASVTSMGESLFNDCTNLTELTVSEGNSAYKSYENCIYTKDGKTLIAAAAGLTSVTILDGVTSIDKEVFYFCISLTSVTIPDGIISIGKGAFVGCSSLTDVNIPDSVTSIGNSAFELCSNLTSVIIPASITSIGENVFNGCSSLTTVTYKGTKAQWEALINGVNIGLPAGATVNCTGN